MVKCNYSDYAKLRGCSNMPVIKQVTLRTIADELGLTVQTVSKALKGKPGMSEVTRHLVVKTAEKLGYFTKEQILSLKADRIVSYSIERKRFLLLQTNNPAILYRQLMEGLRERFASLGHHIELCMMPHDLREKAMEEWIESKGLRFADGLFISPSIMPSLWEKLLLKLPVPKILLGYPALGTKVDSVIWDIYEATYQSVAYLRSIGHTNIMYTGDTNRQRGYILRWQAFLHAMHEFGVQVNPAAHSIGDHNDQHKWLGDLREKLLHYKPTALICGIDGEVPLVYELCRNIGLDIPRDLSMIGLLNGQPDTLPPFTMPVLSIRQTGYRAADRMLWRIANPSLPYEHIRIQGDMLIGTTTAVNDRQ
jgi:LacI family transcriptional regulator